MKQIASTRLILIGFIFWLGSPLGLSAQKTTIDTQRPFWELSSEWADAVFETLTPKERIGQLFMIDAFSNRDESHTREIEKLVKEYGVGGLIFFQGGPGRQANLTNHYQSLAKVPLWVAMDGEWGLGMRLDSTLTFPYQMTLGAVQDVSLIEKMGKEIAQEFQRMGVHVNFAPVVDVNNNAANPVISYRSFGENKNEVAKRGIAYMKGMQDQGLLTTAKHFPGHGDTDVDSHADLPVIKHDRERLNNLELFPFKALMDAGLSGTMVAHLSIPALDPTPKLPSTLSPLIINGLLKREMGFKGLVFTDALNMKGVTKYYEPGRVDVKALIAGNEVLLYSQDIPVAIKAIEKAIQDGELTQETIDARCKKILQAKAWVGLGNYKAINYDRLYADLNSPEAQLLNRALTEASLTLLENKNDVIPLKKLDQTKVMVVSIGADAVTPFQEMAAKYTQVHTAQLSKEPSSAEIAHIKNQFKDYDLVLIGLHQISGRPRNKIGFSEKIIKLVNDVSTSEKGIVTIFRNPYTLDHYTDIHKAEGLIMAYQGGRNAEETAAQLIFGGIGAKGKLPVSVNAHYAAGAGITTRGGIRLKYSLPEEVKWKSGSLEHAIDSIAHAGIRGKAFPGCQILVAKSGKVVFHKTYGFHTYDKKRPTQASDLYDFASLTKVTGPLPALMKLNEEEKFQLDQPFQTYWPEFTGTSKGKLPIRQVLAHNARLKPYITYWTSTKRKNGKFKCKTFKPDSSAKYSVKVGANLYQHKRYKKKIYKAIKKSPLNENPGYVYSGLSFYLWPQIVQNLTGRSYEDYIKQEFYHKLGAYTLTYNPWMTYPLDRIVPTEKDTFFRQELLHGYVHDEGAAMMGGISGNAGLFGTANDLAKLTQMYLNMGEYGGEQLISKETMQEFTRYQYKEEGNRRGLGFDKPMLEKPERGYVSPSASESSFGHSGYTGTFFWVDPKEELVLIFFSNRVYPNRLSRKLYDLNIRPSLHEVLYQQIRQSKEN